MTGCDSSAWRTSVEKRIHNGYADFAHALQVILRVSVVFECLVNDDFKYMPQTRAGAHGSKGDTRSNKQ